MTFQVIGNSIGKLLGDAVLKACQYPRAKVDLEK
jgi:hypothetical protein